MIQGGGFEPGMKQKPTGDADRERGQQRPEERPLHAGHGAHHRAALGHRAVLHQHHRQRLPRLQVRVAAGLGLCGVRQGRRRARTWSTRSSRSRTGRKGVHDDVPVERRGDREASSSSELGVVRCTQVARRRACRRGGAIEFISDLHLAPRQPRTFERWAALPAGTAADAVFILGDLFEVWVGDDARHDGASRRAASMCWPRPRRRRTVCFMAGNRDFLVGDAMLRRLRHVRPCPTRRCSSPSGKRVLLTHGDALCLADAELPALPRRGARAALAARASWPAAGRARGASRARMRDASAARQARTAGRAVRRRRHRRGRCAGCGDGAAAAMVHGHTHRPATEHLAPGFAAPCAERLGLRRRRPTARRGAAARRATASSASRAAAQRVTSAGWWRALARARALRAARDPRRAVAADAGALSVPARARRADDLAELRRLTSLFLDRKEFSGAGGFVVTDAMAVAVAAQACLPVLRLGLELYDGFVGIVMHPDEVVARARGHRRGRRRAPLRRGAVRRSDGRRPGDAVVARRAPAPARRPSAATTS